MAPVAQFEITAQHLRLVQYLVSKLTNHHPDDDLLQIGYLALVQASHRFDPSRGLKPTTYFYHVVRGAILDELTQRAKPTFIAVELTDEAGAETPDPGDWLTDAALWAWIATVLTPSEQRLVGWVYRLGMSYREASMRLQISSSAVHQRLIRIRQKLRAAKATAP